MKERTRGIQRRRQEKWKRENGNENQQFIPARGFCGSTYRWQDGFVNASHCLIVASAVLPRSLVSRRMRLPRQTSSSSSTKTCLRAVVSQDELQRNQGIALNKIKAKAGNQSSPFPLIGLAQRGGARSNESQSQLTLTSNSSSILGSKNDKIPSRMRTRGESRDAVSSNRECASNE